MTGPNQCPLCEGHGTVVEYVGHAHNPRPNGEVPCPDCETCNWCDYRTPEWYDMPDGSLACAYCAPRVDCPACPDCEWVDEAATAA